MLLQNKTAIVTGSNRGIGKAIVELFAEHGAHVWACARRPSEPYEVALGQLAARWGVTITPVYFDLADQTQIKTGMNTILATRHPVDILVNNAGVEKRADFWNVTEAEYDFVMQINLRGTFFITQDFVNHLIATKRTGRIINMSSVHEEMAFPHFSTYCASKGGLKMLCRNLAVELGPLGITVNNIAPGAIATPINKALLNNPELMKLLESKIPLGRLGTPNDVAGLAAFLASDDAAYMTGATFFVDGGLIRNYHEQ